MPSEVTVWLVDVAQIKCIDFMRVSPAGCEVRQVVSGKLSHVFVSNNDILKQKFGT
jgi:hypothetical protein